MTSRVQRGSISTVPPDSDPLSTQPSTEVLVGVVSLPAWTAASLVNTSLYLRKSSCHLQAIQNTVARIMTWTESLSHITLDRHPSFMFCTYMIEFTFTLGLQIIDSIIHCWLIDLISHSMIYC